jgi:hypothetical protein
VCVCVGGVCVCVLCVCVCVLERNRQDNKRQNRFVSAREEGERKKESIEKKTCVCVCVRVCECVC